jgi:septal ring factor EnvC (AmiA/AmiB activator)
MVWGAMKRLVRWAAVGVVAAAVAAPIALLAQSEPPPATSSAPADDSAPNWIRQSAADSQTQLAELEASLSLSTERAAALKAEIEAMKGDRDKQNAALIAASERVKLAEADVAAVEEKLGELIVRELDTRGRLDGADASISNVLAALERISRNPPPALIVDPSDALGSARSAILIAAILPQLQAKADQVMADLNNLNQIKLAAQAEEANLRANFDVLEEEQLRIATLIAARNSNEQSATAALVQEEQEAAAMAERAADLKQLIADLGRRADAVATAAAATEQANASGNAPRLDRETVMIALANPERTEPAVPFASARGFLDFPVSGVNVTNYGDGDGFGGISKGLFVVTRAQAPVIAPADGWVLYAGTYLNYGQIVILDVGQDHTILLAGLDAVDAQVGQFIRMGDRLGSMGSRTIGRTAASSAGASNPTLYIEMRNNNSPIDPTGWWASPTNTTQSG